MSISLEQVKLDTGVQSLEVNEIGQIRFKPDLSLVTMKKHLKSVYRAYKKQETSWRFLLGDMVNDLKLPYGIKKATCRELFGEQAGFTIYSYSLTAAQWDESRREWKMPWSLYKQSGSLPDHVKCALAASYEDGAWNLQKCFEFCTNWKLENAPKSSSGTGFDLKTGIETGSTLTTDSTKYVELPALLHTARYLPDLQAVDALQQALDCRRAELCEEETDRFAEE